MIRLEARQFSSVSPRSGARCFLMLIALIPLAGAPAVAQDASRTGQDELRRRLEQAEARIAALEDLVRYQSEQIETFKAASAQSGPAPKASVSGLPAPAEGAALVANMHAPLVTSTQAQPVASPQAKKTIEAPAERPITHPFQSLKFNSLVQVWYATGQGLTNTFRIRRTELYLTGAVNDKARWQVMIDPAKALLLNASSESVGGTRAITEVGVTQSSRMLQNAFVTLDYIPKLRANIGQYKIPLSLEGLQSSGELDTVERALFASDRARGGTFGDVRDIGITVGGGLGRGVEFQGGIFNGIAETQNEVDRNENKALVGRLVARPYNGLHFGMAGAYSDSDGVNPQRDRWGAEFQYVNGALRLKSELMMGHDGLLSRRGYYGHIGYRIRPSFEVIARVDSWDPDTALESTPASVSEFDYVTGFNVYLWKHHLKLQANYLHKTFGSSALPSRNVLLLNTQAFW